MTLNWQPGDKVIVPVTKTLMALDERLYSDLEMVDWYLTKKSLSYYLINATYVTKNDVIQVDICNIKNKNKKHEHRTNLYRLPCPGSILHYQ